MFICVINNQTVRWCQSVDMVQDMVADCIACLPKGPSITPVEIEVYARIGIYTSKPLRKPLSDGEIDALYDEAPGCECCH